MRTLLGLLAFLNIYAVVAQTEEEVVRARIFESYNKYAKPPGKRTLDLGITLIHYDMNEALNTMDMDFWLRLEWKDTRLSWDEDATGIDVLNYEPDTVWIPDITLYNNADTRNFNVYAGTRIVGRPDGSLLWVPPGHGKAYCYMDMTYWPHDVHNCTFRFGSWVHSNEDLTIAGDDKLVMEHLDESAVNEWPIRSHSLVRIGKYYECCPEEYVTMNVNLVIQRNSPAYDVIVQGPVVALCFLTVVLFILPPTSNEKVTLGGLTLILNFIFLLKVSTLIQHSSSHVPLIVDLISKQIFVTTASVLATAFLSRMVRAPKEITLPSWLESLAIKVAPCLLLNAYKEKVTSTKSSYSRTGKPEEVELKDDGEGYADTDGSAKSKAVWVLLAAIFDRICLLVFLIIFVLLMACYSQVL